MLHLIATLSTVS